MNKKVYVFIVGVILGIVLLNFVNAAEIAGPNVKGSIDFKKIIAPLKKEFSLPVIKVDEKTILPLWLILVILLFLFSLFWLGIKNIPLFKNEPKVAIVVALTLALIVLLTSPAVGWFMWIIGRVWLPTGAILIGLAGLFLLIYLIYSSTLFGTGKLMQLDAAARDNLRNTSIEMTKGGMKYLFTKKVLRDEKDMIRVLGQLDKDVERLIKDFSASTIKRNEFKKELRRISKELLRIGRIEGDIEHLTIHGGTALPPDIDKLVKNNERNVLLYISLYINKAVNALRKGGGGKPVAINNLSIAHKYIKYAIQMVKTILANKSKVGILSP